MDPFRIAVKAFVVNDERKILLIKRRPNDVHKPGVWEIPGGRLELGEDPFLGVKRETKEEVGLEIEVLNPLKIHHFIRQDGQKITMIVFLCKAKTTSVKLSVEHTSFEWLDTKDAYERIVPEFREEIVLYQKFFQGKI